ASELFPARTHWGVIDAAALRQYRFLGRAGLFGVETGTTRGAATFRRSARAILADPDAMLWITPQGRFADVRERPAQLRSGVGHVAECLGRGAILPLAVELTFWDERTAEALLHFGTPLDVAAHPGRTANDWTAAIERALERVQDELAAAAMARDP